MLGPSTLAKLPAACGLSLLLGPAAIGCGKAPSPGDGAANPAPREAKEAKEAEVTKDAKQAEPPRAAPPSTATSSRTFTFTNQCAFDVWIQSVGSNAANIPCSPNTTSAQANCPTGFICYDASENTQYCVPGTTQSTTLPITSQSQITLDASQCASGSLVTDTTSNLWGQCTCATNADCGSNQICGPVGSELYQCFWGYELAQGGQLASKGVDTVTIEVSTTAASAIVASGNFFAQLSCDVNDTCLSDGNLGAPATRIEYTLANDDDFYDVSYINGMNVPVVMTPAPSTSLAYDPGDPYRCMAAGGDATTLQSIASFQQQNGIAGNTQLQPFACTNDYDTTYVGELVGLNFVSPPAGATACKSATDCSSGDVCGLSLDAVTGQNGVALGQLTCGQRLGYWSYAQLCTANSSFSSTALGVDCSDAQTLAYALCTDQPGVSDQGPGRSCFNSNTTTKGETCCGFEAWSFDGKSQPLQVGHSPVSGVDTTFWTTNILPLVKTMKAGCPLAYSYQFDDPYATFTCATQAAPNMASYAITLCPNGDAAGVSPPPPPTCTPTVPAGNGANQFFVSFNSTYITIEVDACDATGSTCTTPVSPTAGSTIFTTTDAARYQITATSSKSNTQQACQLTIPASGCITRAGDFSQPPCNLWQVQTDGTWAGRGISVPTF